jgi:single-stranded-DNA-specific exonuclease
VTTKLIVRRGYENKAAAQGSASAAGAGSAGAATLLAGLHPVLQRVYAARNVVAAHELERSLEHLPAASKLRGIDTAVEVLYNALRHDQRIVIVADYDADGATSCAVAVRVLLMMGAKDVRFVVPDRFKFGYGLTPEIVEIASGHQPDLLITVDNGISSIEGVAAAKQRGMQVLITDHHLPGAVLPAADAIVNPNQPGDEFPSKALAGVGVIFYVMLALRAKLRESGWFESKGLSVPNLASVLDLVALGTVADVVPLDHVNRILVSQGLARIRSGACCVGIRALLEVAGRPQQRIAASDLGFTVGPRLNAAGRLDDMALGIACLLTDDLSQARNIASQLDQLNRERRSIEGDMQTQALAALEKFSGSNLESGTGVPMPHGLCLFDETWHQGVIGILASRIKDRWHRPVIAFAPAMEGSVSWEAGCRERPAASETEMKGSARSINGVHIRDVLDTIAARHPGLLVKFGGHAMAAGLTLKREHFSVFSTAFDEEVRRLLGDEALRGIVLSDGELAPADISMELAETLRSGGPWGQAFAEPVFDGQFQIVNQRVVGEKHLKMLLRPLQDGAGSAPVFDAIAFNVQECSALQAAGVHIAYKLDVNEYKGQRSVQLIVEHIA